MLSHTLTRATHEGELIKPYRLIAVNSVSLIFALAANGALLLNMTRRLSFAIAQPITIVGWFVASFLLIALASVASSSLFRLEPASEHALSQAFYYGIMAAALYFVIASLMIFTVVGAYQGHYPKEFRLTPSQRTLMLQTISFMFYLLIGALVFSKVEGWNYLDAVYWADFTLLTVGVGGEYVPATHTGRSLLFFYAIGGLIMVGLVIGSVRSLVLERGKEKMSARFIELKREKVLGSIDEEEETIKLGLFEKVSFSGKGLDESQRREQEFRIMRRVQQKAERSRRYTALAISSTAALSLWLLGALVFMHSEKPQEWSYFVSLYFAYTSLLTIGYGDYTLSSNSGKAFFVFWSLLAVPTLTILISNMGDTVIKGFKDLTIWIGSLTVLPGDHGIGSTIRIGLERLRHGKLYSPNEEGNEKTPTGTSEQQIFDRLNNHIGQDELERADDADEHGDYLERDIHFYHYILSKEIGQLTKDIHASPPREYTYQEWNYYLRLLGQDENDKSLHRRPKINHDRSKDDQPDLGTASDGDHSTWSWLGIRSPLMGTQSEAQWLLQRMSSTLQRELQKQRSPRAKREPPPISMADLRRKNGRSSSEHDDGRELREKNVGPAEMRRRVANDNV